MKVLSLFDGISCGRLALERAGIPVDRYVAYEIDENAIKISKKNWNDIEYRGDVTKECFSMLEGQFDLLIGGSPCQNLSSMGDGSGLMGEKSRLFFDYIRAKDLCKPKYFLLENNASMTKKNRDAITGIIGCEPILINSADFSAQTRKRLYWTNIPILPHAYKSKSIVLKDILEPVTQKKKYCVTNKVNKYLSDEYDGRKIQKNVKHNICNIDGKANCLSTKSYDIGSNTSCVVKQNGDYYVLTPTEAERLQTLPDGYTDCVNDNKRYFAIGNGWTVDVIAHILSFLPDEYKR